MFILASVAPSWRSSACWELKPDRGTCTERGMDHKISKGGRELPWGRAQVWFQERGSFFCFCFESVLISALLVRGQRV